MIIFSKQRLIYNNNTPFNLNSLSLEIKNKIDKIIRINPLTGASYQIWSPLANVLQFSALNCGQIYTIESNSINYNISNDLISYDTNLCYGSNITPTPTNTPTNTATPTPTTTSAPTPTPTPTSTNTLLRTISIVTDAYAYPYGTLNTTWTGRIGATIQVLPRIPSTTLSVQWMTTRWTGSPYSPTYDPWTIISTQYYTVNSVDDINGIPISITNMSCSNLAYSSGCAYKAVLTVDGSQSVTTGIARPVYLQV